MTRYGRQNMLSHAELLSLAARLTDDRPFLGPVRNRILRYGAPLGCRITHHHTLLRCMDLLRDRALAEKAPVPVTGEVVRADRLTGGQGRFGRHWYAPRGGLHLAFLWADTLLPEWSRFLPFAVGIACCETIRACGLEAGLKWVNDVQIRGRKISGILTETIIGPQGDRYHLIGIGLNINVVQFPAELHGRATSLQLETGQPHGMDVIFTHLLARLQWNIGLLCYGEEQGLCEAIGPGENPVLLRWQELGDSMGRRVVFGYDAQKKPLYEGIVTGLDEQGGLVLRLDDGSSITEYSGEIEYL